MNLKEAFRYQKFLDSLRREAGRSIQIGERCIKTTKYHHMNAANPEAEDKTEVVEPSVPFTPNDDVIRFMVWLVEEKQKLSEAIGLAKMSAGFDIDAAIETNKARQYVSECIQSMLRRKGSISTERGCGYKFNVEGVQTPYYYDVEVKTEEAFDREKSRVVMREAIQSADRVSAEIDAALINTKVNYDPRFDVNESFEDVIAEFLYSPFNS